MNMVAVPVERVVLHAQVVAREVARRVAQVVELVPQNTTSAGRSGDHGHLDGDGHHRLQTLLLLTISRDRLHKKKTKKHHCTYANVNQRT